jgi:endonuclease YncB( thermonuclease family)
LHRKGALGRLFLLLLFLTPALASAQDTAQSFDGTCPASHYDESATVSSVHDGDTIRLEDGRKIRLIGINAPELARGDKPEQAFAANARNQLKQLIASNDYQVKMVYGKERHDRYKRTLAHLFLPNNQNLQVALLKLGLATANVYPPNTAFSDCYRQVEQLARCQSLGIWSDENYTTKKSTELETHTKGFNIISGQVERISESDKGIWLFLDGGIMIGIRTADLPHFDSNKLKSLSGQKIVVRGWLHPKNNVKKGVKFYLRLRHPSAITPVTATENITKC